MREEFHPEISNQVLLTVTSTIQSGSTAAEAAIAKTMETLTSGLEKD